MSMYQMPKIQENTDTLYTRIVTKIPHTQIQMALDTTYLRLLARPDKLAKLWQIKGS